MISQLLFSFFFVIYKEAPSQRLQHTLRIPSDDMAGDAVLCGACRFII